MRLTALAKLFVVSCLFAASLALAEGRAPKSFKPPEEMTAEELAAAKARSKAHINDYGKDVTVETAPFPWMATGLVALAVLIVAPFAVRSYRNTSAEINESAANNRIQRNRPSQE